MDHLPLRSFDWTCDLIYNKSDFDSFILYKPILPFKIFDEELSHYSEVTISEHYKEIIRFSEKLVPFWFALENQISYNSFGFPKQTEKALFFLNTV